MAELQHQWCFLMHHQREQKLVDGSPPWLPLSLEPDSLKKPQTTAYKYTAKARGSSAYVCFLLASVRFSSQRNSKLCSLSSRR